VVPSGAQNTRTVLDGVSSSHADAIASDLDETLPLPTVSLPAFRVDGPATAKHSLREISGVIEVERPLVARPRARRLPAPLWLRVSVVSLFILMLLALTGVVLIRVRPSTLRWLRHALSAQPSTVLVRHRSARASLHLGWSGHGFEYEIPATSYSIQFDVTRPCWVFVRQLPTGATLTEATLQPPGSTVRVKGNVSVEVAARATAIVVREGERILGTIKNPVVGTTYQLIARQ